MTSKPSKPPKRATRTPRIWQKTTADHLISIKRDLQLNDTQLANLLGIHPSTVGQWILHSKAPKWTLLAIEGLRRRSRASARNGKRFIIEVPSEHSQTVLQILKSLNVSVSELREVP